MISAIHYERAQKLHLFFRIINPTSLSAESAKSLFLKLL